MHDPIVQSFFLIFTGAAVIATLALYARQALLVAYIVLGALFGPWGLGLVEDPQVIGQISHVGIVFLLFLLGLDLEPRELARLLREATVVTLASCLVFGLAGVLIGLGFGFGGRESLLVGAAMMFSSTIIGLKLIPTTTLHQQHMGEVVISVLLLQDIIAIVVLLMLDGYAGGGEPLSAVALLLGVKLPGFALLAFLFARYVLHHLLARFDQIHEYLFLVTIGWCLGMAELAAAFGLSLEIGAFIAGVALATSPIARFITESLKPLRDFFLIMFFFALGANFDLRHVPDILLPAVAIAGAALLLKPVVFKFLLKKHKESGRLSGEIGVRLGQISEFSLLITVLAEQVHFIGGRAAYAIQFATILTFIASSYWIVLRYPTPIAVSEGLRRN